MAFASALNTPKGFQCAPSSLNKLCIVVTRPTPANLVLPRHFPARFSSTLALARRKNHRSADTSSSKKKSGRNRVEDGDDALEALFAQLEEDLKNDVDAIDDADLDDISEQELLQIEAELAQAFGIDDEDEDDDDEDDDDVFDNHVVDVKIESQKEEDDDDEEEDDEVEIPVKIKTWQLRRLASALKVGRRKLSIKNLADELCLDRALVLAMLRDPPPSLLMLSATLPDAPARKKSVPQEEPVEIVAETDVEAVVEESTEAAKVESGVKVPVHVKQQNFASHKRIKKVHLETLERIYRKTKRPTNTIVSSIVQVTNLPRKRIVKWFEDKRSEEGIPDSRRPSQPAMSDV